MSAILTTLAPFFVILLIGFTVSFSPRFRDSQRPLNTFVFYVALPCFVFSSVSSAPISAGLPFLAVLIAGGLAITLAVMTYYSCRLMGRKSRDNAAPTSLAATFGNMGFLGIPMAVGVFGSEAAFPASILHLTNSLIFMSGYPLVRTLVEGERLSTLKGLNSRFLRSVFWFPIRSVIGNPVALSLGGALTVRALPLPVPAILSDPVSLLGQAAAPVALFALGLTLVPAFEGIRSGGVLKKYIVLGTGVKLLLLPATTWLVVFSAQDHLGPVWSVTLVLMASMPSSTTVFVFSQQYDGDGRLAAGILVTGTILSAITIPLVMEFTAYL